MSNVMMPQLGESVTEGTLGKWLKNVGENVTKYEPLVEVITDKVNAEIPSDYDGVLEEIVVHEGETVSVGTVLARIRESEQENPVTEEETQTSLAVQSTIDEKPPEEAVSGKPSASQRPASGRYSPAVMTLAQTHGIDLSTLIGTGEGGRITRKDVEAKIAGLESQAPAPSRSSEAVSPIAANADLQGQSKIEPATGLKAAPLPASGDVEDEVVTPSAIRKTIAKRMVESKHQAPHAWTMVEADVTRLVAFRESMKKEFARKEGVVLTYMPFFIKAVVEALKQFPMINASWEDDGIHVKKRIHIALAVATDDTLVLPVIHDADRLSLSGLAHAVHDLAVKARSGRLTLEDVQGGTFTVNNTGAFGSILSQPIIPLPQAAILSVESIVKRPVVVDEDAIAIRSMVNLCLSLDHRVLDGWIVGQFLRLVKERLQSFGVDTPLF